MTEFAPGTHDIRTDIRGTHGSMNREQFINTIQLLVSRSSSQAWDPSTFCPPIVYEYFSRDQRRSIGQDRTSLMLPRCCCRPAGTCNAQHVVLAWRLRLTRTTLNISLPKYQKTWENHRSVMWTCRGKYICIIISIRFSFMYGEINGP